MLLLCMSGVCGIAEPSVVAVDTCFSPLIDEATVVECCMVACELECWFAAAVADWMWAFFGWWWCELGAGACGT